MDSITIGIVGILVLLILVLLRMPIGAATALIGTLGFASIAGWESTLSVLQTVPFITFASQAMSRWIFVIAIGMLCVHAGLIAGCFTALWRLLARFDGGMVLAGLITTAMFSTLSSGIFMALGVQHKITWPQLPGYNFKTKSAFGALIAGGNLGFFMPPAALLLIYGIITEKSIGGMFLAAIIPALLALIMYVAIIIWNCDRQPAPAPTPELRRLNGPAWILPLVFAFMAIGLWVGIFVPTEAGSLGILLLVVFTLIYRKLNFEVWKAACLDTLVVTGKISLLFLGAMLFGYLLTMTRLPYELSEWMYAANLGPKTVLIIVLVFITLLSCLFDGFTMILLVTPVIYPVVLKSGIDPILFGVLTVRCITLGLYMPTGLNFRGTVKFTGMPFKGVSREFLPFWCADIILLALLIIFPVLVTWLPTMLYS